MKYVWISRRIEYEKEIDIPDNAIILDARSVGIIKRGDAMRSVFNIDYLIPSSASKVIKE